jgi:osmotically-inducible protein OsmY
LVRRHSDARELEAWIDDEKLLALIVQALENEPVFWISVTTRRTAVVVEVEKGFVTLSGFVRSSEDRRLADIIARAQGALGVDNGLRLVDEVQWD